MAKKDAEKATVTIEEMMVNLDNDELAIQALKTQIIDQFGEDPKVLADSLARSLYKERAAKETAEKSVENPTVHAHFVHDPKRTTTGNMYGKLILSAAFGKHKVKVAELEANIPLSAPDNIYIQSDEAGKAALWTNALCCHEAGNDAPIQDVVKRAKVNGGFAATELTEEHVTKMRNTISRKMPKGNVFYPSNPIISFGKDIENSVTATLPKGMNTPEGGYTLRGTRRPWQ